MAYERWDIVIALFPFTDATARKPRPVLVLSGLDFNREHGHLIGCMVTTGARSRWPSDHPIRDLVSTGLTHSSVLRWKVFTLPFGVIGRRIGMLADADRGAVAARLTHILAA